MAALASSRRAVLAAVFWPVWLAGCYPAVTNYSGAVGPRFAGAPARAARMDSVFHVVTWNVKWGRQAAAAGEMLANHDRLRAADVVLLQEMNEHSVSVIARRLGFGYVYYPATVHPRVRTHVGNAILSPWPITEDGKLVLPHRGRFVKTERVAVRATVTINGRRIRVYSLHLATPFEVGEAGIEDQLEAVIRDAEQSGDPVLIGGDFNSSRVGGLLMEAGYQWVTRRIGPTVWMLPLDHVFVRGLDVSDAAAGVVAAEPMPSDHRPVWAIFQP
jgi:endonuclease/exonuclease/phosphatase (EEP) superfamily protein YafD